MMKKVIASFGLFAFVYFNQHTALVTSVFEQDLPFALFSSVYEERFGLLLPAVGRTSQAPLSYVSTNSPLAAGQDGTVIRILDEQVVVQQEDGTEVEIHGLKTGSYRLFERIKKGEMIGDPSGSVIQWTERKDGQIISSRKVNVNE